MRGGSEGGDEAVRLDGRLAEDRTQCAHREWGVERDDGDPITVADFGVRTLGGDVLEAEGSTQLSQDAGTREVAR